MQVVHVQVHVKPDCIEAFTQASMLNASSSRKEPGVVRFDVLQQADAPEWFVLVEVYRTEADAKAHKDTQHYLTWRDTVAPMMAEPRKGIHYITHTAFD